MFGTIRRHQKWLWILISTVTIISFVAFFSPQQRKQRGWTGPKDYIGSINGRSVTRNEYAEAYHEAQLRYLFTYGEWPGNDAMSRQGMMEREANNRLFLIEKIKELDIQVGESSIAQWILEAFKDRTEKASHRDTYERYEQFVKTVLPNHGLTQNDFENFARHEVGIQHLVTLAGIAGKLVPPQEAEALFRRQNEEAQAEAVFVSSTNFTAQVKPDPNAIATYYTNHLADYRVPDKIQVTYVKFATSNFVDEAKQTLSKDTNLTQALDASYRQRGGTNTFKDANGAPLSPEAAREKIRTELQEKVASDLAQKKAYDFANELFEAAEKATSKSNILENFAAAKGVPTQVTQPFSSFEQPPGLRVPPTFMQMAFNLTPEAPLAEQPIQADDGVYVIEFNKKIPSHIPPLDSLREKVTQDYINSQALEMARAQGKELQKAFSEGLTSGKTFDAVAAEKNVSPIVLAPFTRKTPILPSVPNRAESGLLVNTAFSLAPGKLSGFVETRTGGFIVFLKALDPVSDAKVKADLPEFTKSLRQSRQYEAFAEWFQKQEAAARINLPGENKRAGLR